MTTATEPRPTMVDAAVAHPEAAGLLSSILRHQEAHRAHLEAALAQSTEAVHRREVADARDDGFEAGYAAALRHVR